MTDPRYKKYEDCNIEELEQIVEKYTRCGKRSQISH